MTPTCQLEAAILVDAKMGLQFRLPCEAVPMPGDAHGTLSRWIQRRSAIVAVIFAVVVLPVLPTGAATWAGPLAETTAASRLGRSQPEPAFRAAAVPNSAGPGHSVTVSFFSPDPYPDQVTITGCTAGFPGGDTRKCRLGDFRRSVMLQVPADAAPGSLEISATVAWSTAPTRTGAGRRGHGTRAVHGRAAANLPRCAANHHRGAANPRCATHHRGAASPTPTTEVPPTPDVPPTTEVPPTTDVPPTTEVSPTTDVSPTIPPGIIPIVGTSSLWLLLVVLVLVLLALTAALVGRRSREAPPGCAGASTSARWSAAGAQDRANQ